MTETPDPAAELARPEPGPDGDETGHEPIDVAEWVSELRRLYVEPTARAELQRESGLAPLRRMLHLRGSRQAQSPVEKEAVSEHLSPMKASPSLQDLAQQPVPDLDPAVPDAEQASAPAEGAPEVTSEPGPSAPQVSQAPGVIDEPTSAAWLLSYLEATGATAKDEEPEAGGDEGAPAQEPESLQGTIADPAPGPDAERESEPEPVPRELDPRPAGEAEVERQVGRAAAVVDDSRPGPAQTEALGLESEPAWVGGVQLDSESDASPAVVNEAVSEDDAQPEPATAVELEPDPAPADQSHRAAMPGVLGMAQLDPEPAVTGAPDLVEPAPALTGVGQPEPELEPAVGAVGEPELSSEEEPEPEVEPALEAVDEFELGTMLTDTGEAQREAEPEPVLTREGQPEPELGPAVEAVDELTPALVVGAEPELAPDSGSGPAPAAAPESALEQDPGLEGALGVGLLSEPPAELPSDLLAAESGRADGPAPAAAISGTPVHDGAPSESSTEPPDAPRNATTSHPVTVSWRGEEAMDYLELGGLDGGDPNDRIIVEPPSQMMAQPRRRRPERPPEADATRDGGVDQHATTDAAEPLADSRTTADGGPVGRPSRTGRRVLLVGVLLVILAAAIWYGLLRDSDLASAPSTTGTHAVAVAATPISATHQRDLTG